MRSSAMKPGHGIPNRSQKVLQNQESHFHPGHFDKESERICPANQQSRSANLCSSGNLAEGSSKYFSEKKQIESQLQEAPFSVRNSTSPSAKLEEPVLLDGPVAGASTSTSRHQEDPVEQLFLNFKSLMLIMEDADEDSGSDLSDSEKIPIASSPFTPPDLNLRAERIDPASFDHLCELDYKGSEHYYPEALPPPFNAWDLQQLAMFLNTEGRRTSRPKPVGHLEKYVDRLLQLEWLQMQTIQSEKAKVVKVRPHTAPSNFHNLKSPGKSKSWPNPLPSRVAGHSDDLLKLSTCHVSNHRKKDLYFEETSLLKSAENYSSVAVVTNSKASREMRPASKKRPTESNKQQFMELHPSSSFLKIQSIDNVRPPKTSPGIRSPAPPVKGTKVNLYAKKNGKANNGQLPSKRATQDQKVKINGVKQPTCKRK
ncbi:protein FAM217B isoform X2 [Ambystoma mexicanum]